MEGGLSGQTGLTAVRPAAMAAGFASAPAPTQPLSMVERTALENQHTFRIASSVTVPCTASGCSSRHGPPAVSPAMEEPRPGLETSTQLCTVETTAWETALKCENATLMHAQVRTTPYGNISHAGCLQAGCYHPYSSGLVQLQARREPCRPSNKIMRSWVWKTSCN